LGSTLVCKDMTLARSFAYASKENKHKIVTLGGHVIHKTGNITGGAVADLASKAAGFDEKQVAELREQKTAIVKVRLPTLLRSRSRLSLVLLGP
jgi:chromosome segregation ATPase